MFEHRLSVAICLAAIMVTGCSQQGGVVREQAQEVSSIDKPDQADGLADGALREVFPGVWVDRQARVVELDGWISTDVHDPQTPDVFLEVLVCTPDTREYESLVVVSGRAEHVQAGLLLAGFMPGRPGYWSEEGGEIVGTGPEGDPVEVVFIVDGKEVEPWSWVVIGPERKFAERMRWIFGGSKFGQIGGREVFLAGVEGTIVGLTTFGTEIVGLESMHHPDSSVEQPEYMARNEAVPEFGTPVVVRFRRVVQEAEPAESSER